MEVEKRLECDFLGTVQRLSSVLAVVVVAFLAAVAIISTQLQSVRRSENADLLLSINARHPILSLAQTLVTDEVPSQLAMTTASALSILQNLCGQPPNALPGSVSSYAAVKRNREK